VLRRFPDPGEVLELIGGEDTVGPGQRAPLREERGQHRERQPGEHDEHRELEAIEPERERAPVARRARTTLLAS
jgi:hypothetical protein